MWLQYVMEILWRVLAMRSEAVLLVARDNGLGTRQVTMMDEIAHISK